MTTIPLLRHLCIAVVMAAVACNKSPAASSKVAAPTTPANNGSSTQTDGGTGTGSTTSGSPLRLDLTGAVAVGVQAGSATLDLLDATAGSAVKLDSSGVVTPALTGTVPVLAMQPTNQGMVVVFSQGQDLTPSTATATSTGTATAATAQAATAQAAIASPSLDLANTATVTAEHDCLIARSDSSGALTCLVGGGSGSDDASTWDGAFGNAVAAPDATGGMFYAVQLNNGSSELRHVDNSGAMTVAANAITGGYNQLLAGPAGSVLVGDPTAGLIAANQAGTQQLAGKFDWMATMPDGKVWFAAQGGAGTKGDDDTISTWDGTAATASTTVIDNGGSTQYGVAVTGQTAWLLYASGLPSQSKTGGNAPTVIQQLYPSAGTPTTLSDAYDQIAPAGSAVLLSGSSLGGAARQLALWDGTTETTLATGVQVTSVAYLSASNTALVSATKAGNNELITVDLAAKTATEHTTQDQVIGLEPTSK